MGLCPHCTQSDVIPVVMEGNLWRIHYVRRIPGDKRNELHGICYHSDRNIFIHSQQDELLRMDTTIHELTHGCFPRASEHKVTQFATAAAHVLYTDGYRRG